MIRRLATGNSKAEDAGRVNSYTEELLADQPAVQLFGELDWRTVGTGRIFGPNGLLERETRSEVVLLPKLRAVLERLNSALPADADHFCCR